MNLDKVPLPYGDLSARLHIAGHFAELAQLLEPRVRKEDMINVIDYLMKHAGYLANLIDCNFSKSEIERKKDVYKQLVEKSLLVIMMGARRHGKTTSAFDTACRIRDMDTGKDIYWFGFSPAVKKYYPWIKQTTNLRKIENAFLLFDEAAIFMIGRKSMTNERIKHIQMLPTLGHRDVSTVYMTQLERIDSWLWGLCDWIWFKPYPGVNFTETNLKGLDMHRFMIPTQKWQNYIYDRQNGKPYFFDNGFPPIWNNELSKPYSLIKDFNDALNYMAELMDSSLSQETVTTMLELRGWTLEELTSDDKWVSDADKKRKNVSKKGFPVHDVAKAVQEMKGNSCQKCGSYDRQRYGFGVSKGKKVQKWRCTSCGAITYEN